MQLQLQRELASLEQRSERYISDDVDEENIICGKRLDYIGLTPISSHTSPSRIKMRKIHPNHFMLFTVSMQQHAKSYFTDLVI